MVYLCSLILLISYASYSYLIPSYRCLQLYLLLLYTLLKKIKGTPKKPNI